ncbi:MAG TPA: hypothetical protein VGC78_11020 [Gaiellaceae bacterium]|jgi:hypothetical protein
MRALLTLAIAAAVAVSTGSATAKNGPPPFPKLSGAWTHVDVNRRINGEWHTLSLDRGRVAQVTATQIKLREADGSVVPITLSPATMIVFRGFGPRPAYLRRGLFAMTMRIDDGPAVRVRVTRLP